MPTPKKNSLARNKGDDGRETLFYFSHYACAFFSAKFMSHSVTQKCHAVRTIVDTARVERGKRLRHGCV